MGPSGNALIIFHASKRVSPCKAVVCTCNSSSPGWTGLLCSSEVPVGEGRKIVRIFSVGEFLVSLSFIRVHNHVWYKSAVPRRQKLLALHGIMLHLPKISFNKYKSAVSYELRYFLSTKNLPARHWSVFTFKYPVDDDGFISMNRALPTFQTESQTSSWFF